MGDLRTQSANIIIRKKNVGSASNDIGFLKKADGTYELIISQYDRHGRAGKKLLEELTQVYAKHKVIKQAKRMGYTVKSQSVDEDGKMKIKIMSRY